MTKEIRAYNTLATVKTEAKVMFLGRLPKVNVFMPTAYFSAWNKVMMFRMTSEAFIMLSSGTYSNLPWKL